MSFDTSSTLAGVDGFEFEAIRELRLGVDGAEAGAVTDSDNFNSEFLGFGEGKFGCCLLDGTGACLELDLGGRFVGSFFVAMGVFL